MERPFFPRLSSSVEVDVCVVGAGIAGLSTAYQLLKDGASVVILDREPLGLGETGLSSGHLSSALDDRFTELRRLHGETGARLAYESHARAIDHIERLTCDENIDCDFERVDGFLFRDPERSRSDLQEELQAAHGAGFNGVSLLESAPTKLFDTGECLRFPRQAQLHPLKYLVGLIEATRKLGGRLFTRTEAVEVQGGRRARVSTSEGHQVTCGAVVMATNVPVNNRIAVHLKMAPYRTYIIGVQAPPDFDEKALFWDTAEPYHYLRFARSEAGQRLLLIGGEDHRTGQGESPDHHFAKLEVWCRHRLGLEPRVLTRWSGQILEPIDRLAFIGHNPGDEENIYIVTGDSGHGLTHGTIAGLLIPDLIAGRENPWSRLYDPGRLKLRSLASLLRETWNASRPYGDWFSAGDVESADEIPAGEGAVVRDGLGKLAVYRDTLGRTHTLSAVCPHLGGLVRWNTAEKTWDCPCHGSRFDKFGEVINGPASQGLEPVDELSPGQRGLSMPTGAEPRPEV